MTKGARRGKPAARLAVLALLACEIACACSAGEAHGDTRFGDSTWVAPGVPLDADFTTEGPRIAPPDHERGWETALRAPFRVVFFPLRLVAMGLEAAAGYVGPRYFEPKAPSPPKRGPVLAPYLSLGAVNDIGVGPSITWAGVPTADGKLQLAGTWSTIDRRRVRFSATSGDQRSVGFRLRAEYDYKPNRRYFGIGNDTPETDRSHYLLESTNAEAALVVGASPLRQLRIVGGYSHMSPRRGYHGQPLLEDVFSPATAPFEHQTTKELLYGVAADLAALDETYNPSLGVHGRVDLRRAAGLRDSDPDYDQWWGEGRAYLPVFAKRRVIAVRGVYTGVEPRGDATTVLPYYRLAQSQSASRFAGYSSERFRDEQLVLARIEYRWEIFNRLSAVALYELGQVAPERRAFRLDDMHASYGGGLRLGGKDKNPMRFELAKSVEGFRAAVILGRDF